MNTNKTLVEYTIEGRAKDPGNPMRFLALGMRGKPQVKLDNGGLFSITGCIRNDDALEDGKDLQILKDSLRDAIKKCDCSLIRVRVSLTVEES